VSIRGRLEQRTFTGSADEAVVSILVAADQVDRALSAVVEPHGITTDQYNVLRILRGVHAKGHPRREIARRMIRRAPDVTRMLDRLIKRKLIVRIRDPEDGRLSVARIAPTGINLLARIDPEIEAAQLALTSTLTQAELRQLVRLCNSLVR